MEAYAVVVELVGIWDRKKAYGVEAYGVKENIEILLGREGGEWNYGGVE